MQLMLINGSPRKNGATFNVLNHFYEYFKNNFSDINIEFVNLIDLNIKYCIGCKNCYKTGKCVIKDDNVEIIREKLKNCDGLIWGSPTYASNVSGLFKNFYDRIHITMDQSLYKKPCINITTYENAMGNKALKIMKEIVNNSGGYNVNSVAIKIISGQNILDKNKLKIERMAKHFIKVVDKNNIPLFSILFTKIIVNIFLKPFVFKDKENNYALINSWKEKKIIK